LVELQVNAVLCPVTTVLGFAEKELTVGIDGAAAKPTQPVRHKVIELNTAARSANLADGLAGVIG